MSETRLLIDVGNSRVKWAWARGRVLDIDGDTDYPERGDIEAFTRACRAAGAPRPDAVSIASVANAALSRQVEALCAAAWACEPQRLQTRAKQGGVTCGYREPAQLGVDRWLAIVGAVETHGKPVVVWDLGTAATLDAVDPGGRHVGGWILPGPATMLDALRHDTQLTVPGDLQGAGAVQPGKATAECIARGVLAAQLGSLGEFLGAVANAGVERPVLVVTGGAAGMVLPLLDREHIHDPWLVFRGMVVD